MSEMLLPAPLPGYKVGFEAIRRACVKAGVPLADRYGFAIPDGQLAEATRIVRRAKGPAAAGGALECAVLMGDLEIASPSSAAFPIGPADAHALAQVLRSPLADLAVLPALTVRWPHVAAIVFPAPEGCVPKTTENRTRKTDYRGPVAIHAGLAWDPRSTASLAQRHWENCGGLDHIPFDLCQGSILAVADLVDCHRSDGACCRPWGETSPEVWHWQLANVRRLSEPVAARGQLGLWRVPADAAALVAAQLEAETA